MSLTYLPSGTPNPKTVTMRRWYPCQCYMDGLIISCYRPEFFLPEDFVDTDANRWPCLRRKGAK